MTWTARQHDVHHYFTERHPNFPFVEFALGISGFIFSENPGISKEDYEKEMLLRIEEVEPLAKKYFSALDADRKYVSAVSNLFDSIHRAGGSYAKALASLKANGLLLHQWVSKKTNRITELGEGFRVYKSSGSHPESVLELSVWKDFKKIATIGGRLERNGKLKLVITNLQGKPVSKAGKRDGLADASLTVEYSQLNKLLGCDWRAYFVKQVVATGKSKGLEVVGELPRRSYFTDLKKYTHAVRKQAQAFREGGLRSKDGGKTWNRSFQKSKPKKRPIRPA